MVLNTFLKKFTLSNNDIINFKQNRQKDDVEKRGDDLNFKVKIKSVLYFIISFIFLKFIHFII